MTHNSSNRHRQGIPLLSRPFVFLALCYLAGIIFLALFRMTFLLINSSRLSGVEFGSILHAFAVGWRFDQIVILVILAPMLLVLPWIGLRSRSIRAICLAYLTAVFSACTILLLADLRFFKYFRSHLNFQSFQYLTEGGGTTWHLIRTEPAFLPCIVIWIVITAALLMLWRHLLRATASIPDRHLWLTQIVTCVIYLSLTFLGVRGRVALSPIDWGIAYFSNNDILNQSTLNGIYTLGKAFSEEGHDPRLVYLPESARFPFVDFKIGLDTLRQLLQSPRDSWLEPDKSLLRKTSQPESHLGFKPNVVIVLMESWTARNTGALGSPDSLTPNFDQLAAHGLLFTDFYASGTRTNYGIPATLFAYPSLPGRSILTRYNANHPFVSVSDILHDRGYYNLFIYGGDIVFDNMEGFLKTQHYDRLLGDRDLGTDQVFAKWGIPDHIVFHDAVALADSLPRPFQMTVLTLSNHEPFDLPDSSVQRYHGDDETSKLYNAQLYADFALGKFIEEMRSRPMFDSTIFVFTADHTRYGYGLLRVDPIDFHIPLLIYSPALLADSGKRITRISGQTDILPTLMGLLGGDYVHQSWGRNLLDSSLTDSGYAVINVLTSAGMICDGLLYSETVGGPQESHRMSNLTAKDETFTPSERQQLTAMQRRLRIFLQIADQLSTPQTTARP